MDYRFDEVKKSVSSLGSNSTASDVTVLKACYGLVKEGYANAVY